MFLYHSVGQNGDNRFFGNCQFSRQIYNSSKIQNELRSLFSLSFFYIKFHILLTRWNLRLSHGSTTKWSLPVAAESKASNAESTSYGSIARRSGIPNVKILEKTTAFLKDDVIEKILPGQRRRPPSHTRGTTSDPKNSTKISASVSCRNNLHTDQDTHKARSLLHLGLEPE